MTGAITFWVIYHGARNHPPGVWVVRAQDVIDGVVRPRETFVQCGSLEEARRHVPPGCVPFERDPSDDPVIVESWMQ